MDSSCAATGFRIVRRHAIRWPSGAGFFPPSFPQHNNHMSPKPEAPPPRTCTGHPVTGSKAADGAYCALVYN